MRNIKTYQALTECTSESARMSFIEEAIAEHKGTLLYKVALDAYQYCKGLNPTIMKYQKLLYTITGKAVPDNYTANHKCTSNWLYRFIVQENQYLLGNGVQFQEDATKDALGGSKFDGVLQNIGFDSLWGGLAFGFYNLDRIENFNITEFVPLWDEEDGALKAGIRFWQIAEDKPLRCTLYELDGYTNYIKRSGESMKQLNGEKRAYKLKISHSEADGDIIYVGENYPTFPIVPLWGNRLHQSELVGRKSKIDCFDLIESGFANDLDDASMIYWTIQNAGGMDDIDLVKFVERMKTVKAAVIDDEGASAEAHTIDVPYQSREAYLQRLETDLYNDFMALNTRQIASGNVTATQINAAYEDLNLKVDGYEYCIIDFINGLLAIAEIEDEPTFRRSRIVNQLEETQMVLSASTILDNETLIRHLPFLSVDEINDILDRIDTEEMARTEAKKEALEELQAEQNNETSAEPTEVEDEEEEDNGED